MTTSSTSKQIRGIRQSIPGGSVLGRTAPGTGAVEVLSLTNLGVALVSAGHVGSPTGQQWNAGTVNATSGQFYINQNTLEVVELANVQSGTTYAVQASDLGYLINSTSTSVTKGITVNATSLPNGFFTDILASATNSGNKVQIKSTSGTIGNGGSTYYAIGGQTVRIINNGTNFQALPWSPFTQNSAWALGYPGMIVLGVGNTISGALTGNIVVGPTNSVTASSSGGVGVFGLANTVTANGADSVAIGYGHTMSGEYNMLLGAWVNDWGWSNGALLIGAYPGTSKSGLWTMTGQAIGTAVARMGPGGSIINGNQVGALPTGTISAMGFKLHCIARDRQNGGVATWEGTGPSNSPGIMAQTSTAVASNTIASGFTFASGSSMGTFSGIGSWSIAADTTLGGFNLTYTPGVSNTATVDLSAMIEFVWVT